MRKKLILILSVMAIALLLVTPALAIYFQIEHKRVLLLEARMV